MNTRSSLIVAICLVALGCSRGPLDNGPAYDVIVLAGQSNMDGRAAMTELSGEMRAIPENVVIVDRTTGPKLNKPDQFGPEIGMAHDLGARYPERHFALVKYAVGGTSLEDWRLDGPLYRGLVEHLRVATDGAKVRIVALCWFQGETDTKSAELGDQWGQRFERLVAQFRADAGEPELPVILGRVSTPPDEYPAIDTVRAAQETAAERPAMFLVTADDLPKLDDGLHYNADGQLELGLRFGRAVGQVLEPEPALAD